MEPRNDELARLGEELARLRAENERLRAENDSVAAANVEAALRLVEASEQRAQDAEQREAELRERHEELQRATKLAESAVRAKEEFLRTVSHELRTPLNGILGMSELLLSVDLGADGREFAEGVRRSADHLVALVDDILDFSKLEEGKMEFERVPWRIADVVRGSVEVVATQAVAKGISIDYDVDDALPVRVLLDPLRVKQVLLNLLTNAVKFTDEGKVELRVTGSDDELRFEVEDTGIGIPEDRLERVFESFRQADGSTTRKYGGTGLGLAISSSMAEGMGGRLDVRSVEAEGSTFILRIPLEPAEEPATDERDERSVTRLAASAGAVASTPTVLVVDDVQENLRVTELLLVREGYRVLLAKDGSRALEVLAEERVDLVLLDLHMPGIDGHETVRRIRDREELAGLHVIGLTAGTLSDRDQEGFVQAGADEVLFKPIRPELLLAAVAARLAPPTRSEESSELDRARREFFGEAS